MAQENWENELSDLVVYPVRLPGGMWVVRQFYEGPLEAQLQAEEEYCVMMPVRQPDGRCVIRLVFVGPPDEGYSTD